VQLRCSGAVIYFPILYAQQSIGDSSTSTLKRGEPLSAAALQNVLYRTVFQLWVASWPADTIVNRRLSDRIRKLCALAVAADRDDERELILAELQSALHEHNKR
jgi:hypothetical protein